MTVLTAVFLMIPMQANATEISAMMDATLAAQRSNVEASNDAIKGLQESIADAERLIRSMAETQEFLDSVRGCFICFPRATEIDGIFPQEASGSLSEIESLSGSCRPAPPPPPSLFTQVVGPTGEEAKPKLCPALEAPLIGTFNISFETGSTAAPEEIQQRRRLLRVKRASSGSRSRTAIDYGGYSIYRSDLDRLKYVNLDGAPELARWLGASKGGNRVLGGLVLHATRQGLDVSPSVCQDSYAHLSSQCAQKQFYDR